MLIGGWAAAVRQTGRAASFYHRGKEESMMFGARSGATFVHVDDTAEGPHAEYNLARASFVMLRVQPGPQRSAI